MPVEPNLKYEATVTDAYIVESTKKGTPGLFMSYSTAEGSIDHIWYISPGNREWLSDTLVDCFKIDPKELNRWDYLDTLGDDLRGKRCEIVTIETQYEGEMRVEVKYMNSIGGSPRKLPPPRISDALKLQRVAGLFGGGPVSSPAYKTLAPRSATSATASAAPPEFENEDVPF